MNNNFSEAISSPYGESRTLAGKNSVLSFSRGPYLYTLSIYQHLNSMKNIEAEVIKKALILIYRLRFALSSIEIRLEKLSC